MVVSVRDLISRYFSRENQRSGVVIQQFLTSVFFQTDVENSHLKLRYQTLKYKLAESWLKVSGF